MTTENILLKRAIGYIALIQKANKKERCEKLAIWLENRYQITITEWAKKQLPA